MPVAKPSECTHPLLPEVQTLREAFDNLSLEDQIAMLANTVVTNEHRRHTAEQILERCGKWVSEQ